MNNKYNYNKYIKYLYKNEKTSNLLHSKYQQGGNNIIKIKSNIYKYYDYIYVITKNNGVSYMKFVKGDSIDNEDAYQSMYNKNDLDNFYLSYFSPLLSCFDYVNSDYIKKILIVGLGGGHIPMFLRSKLPDLFIDVVEIDENVINAAQHMGFVSDDMLHVTIDDGSKYIKSKAMMNELEKYNIIIMDLDGKESFESFDFIDVKNSLTDEGILAINSYNGEFGKSDLLDRLKCEFKLIKYYKIVYNDIFLCTNNLSLREIMITPITFSHVSNVFSNFKYLDQHIDNVNNNPFSIVIS
jgi:hypothetical protein